jgi:hypothetical protein
MLSSCSESATDHDKMLEVSFRPLAQIGGSADTTLLLRTLLPASVGVDSAGRIYVLDASEGRIRVYTPTGELITTLGRRGGGPGEIINSFSARLAVSPNGTVWVFDRGRGGLTGFHTNGTILPTIPLQVGGLLWGLAVDDSMRAVVLSNRGDSVVLRRTDGDVADTLETIILPSVRPLDASRCGLAGHSDRPIFSLTPAWATSNGMVAIADQDSFALRVVAPDRQSQLLTRPRPARRATPELAARMLPDGWSIEMSGQGRCTIPSAEVVAQIGHAAVVPPYEAVVFDRRERLWALRTRIPGESTLADIFSLRDGYEGTVALGDVWPVAFLPGGSLASIEHDESDAPLVRIYAMGWRGRGAP